MTDPAELAKQTVIEIISEGAKTHGAEDWRTEPTNKHLDKAVRHIMSHKLIRDGHQATDGEDHLKNALTRLAMVLCILSLSACSPCITAKDVDQRSDCPIFDFPMVI